jgi:hypothetical protein
VGLDDLLHQGQPQAGSRYFAGPRHSVKTLENLFLLVGRNAGTLVLDPEQNPLAVCPVCIS